MLVVEGEIIWTSNIKLLDYEVYKNFKCIFLFIITNIPLAIYGQYNGGSGGGFSNYNINQIICPPVSYPDIFAGGEEDGYNQTGITQVICPPVSYPDIFAGGEEDGYNQTGLHRLFVHQ